MYNPTFVPGHNLPFPQLSPRIQATAFSNGALVHHTRFSILFSQVRHFAIATAHNIDGETTLAEGTIPRRNRFRLDPDIPRLIQVDNDRGYRSNLWDRGHLVRRASLHWGAQGEAETADSESFFWSNIAPQHERLHDTAWGDIEDWMLELADNGDRRAAIFRGPVLSEDDPHITNRPGEEPVQIPAGFWKIIAIRHNQNLRAAAFLVWQRDFDSANPVDFDPVLEQVRITTLEYLTGLSFLSLWAADPLRFGVQFDNVPRRASIRAGSARIRATAITRKADILL